MKGETRMHTGNVVEVWSYDHAILRDEHDTPRSISIQLEAGPAVYLTHAQARTVAIALLNAAEAAYE